MNCKNCNTALNPESDYCFFCGGKVIRNRLTIKNLFEHVSETFFNYDNKLLRTFTSLFKKPEDVIGGYISGVRKKYVNPVSYFGLAITLTGLYLLILNKFFPETIDYSIMTFEGQEDLQKKNINFIQEYMSIFMMLYVPIYALIAWITFVGINKFNYTELLVSFLYLQGQMSITTVILGTTAAIFGITQGAMSLIFAPLMIFYCAYCLKRLYQLNFSQMLLRTLLFIAVLGVFFIILSIGSAIIMYINGDFEQIMEAQKAAAEAAKQTQ